MIRFFVRLLTYALIVCFLGSLWGGWYLSKQGFGRKWRKKLSEEFAKRGVEMTARRLTLDPLRGLVAREVRVFRDDDHEETIATIDELRLDINYTRLLQNEPFLDALSLSEAEVTLDVDPTRANSGEFAIHHLGAQLYFQPDKLEIRRLQGEGLGVFFTIDGVLEHQANWQNSPHPPLFWKQLGDLRKEWLEALAEVHFGKKLGRLDLRFRGNLSQKRWLQSADLHLDIPDVRWRGVRCESVALEADFAERLVTLRHLSWKDEIGPISLSGTWQPSVGGHLQADARGNTPAILQEMKLLPAPVSAAKIKLQGDLSWNEKGTANQPPEWKIVGSFDASQVIYRGVIWEQAQTHFSLSSDRYFLRDIRLRQKDGELSGQCLGERQQTEAEFVSTVNPRVLWLSLGTDIPDWLEDFDFGVNPWLHIKIAKSPETAQDWQYNGQIVFGRTNFRGVALTSAQADFNKIGANLALGQVQITRPEGQCTGEAFWNNATGELTFWDAKSSIDLVAWGLWTERSLADALETMRLPKGTILEGDGRLNWKENRVSQGEMTIRCDALELLATPVLKALAEGEEANIFRVQARLRLADKVLRVDELQAANERLILSGNGNWSLQTQRLNGQLELQRESQQKQSWETDSPWAKVKWSQRAD